MKKFWFNASDDVRGIPLTRYVASWYAAGGRQDRHKVEAWLRSLVINGSHLTEEEIELVASATVNGKLELEELAKQFV